MHALRAQLNDASASSRNQFDEPLMTEKLKSFTHRSSRCTEQFGQFNLRESLAGAEGPVHDRVRDLLGDQAGKSSVIRDNPEIAEPTKRILVDSTLHGPTVQTLALLRERCESAATRRETLDAGDPATPIK